MVAREVEVGGDRSRGWIDVLAFHAPTGLLLVIEVKAELHDLGQIERTLGWYEREAWAAARRHGWQPRAVLGALLLLETEANEVRIASNRETLSVALPMRAAALTACVSTGTVASRGGQQSSGASRPALGRRIRVPSGRRSGSGRGAGSDHARGAGRGRSFGRAG
jgi:hypothetical protein